MKKTLFSIFLFIVLFPIVVNGSSNTAALINGKYYDTLNEAIAAANENDVIKLMTNVNLNESLLIDKVINIDLNNNNITSPSIAFLVEGGTLNVSGTGTIKETEPNYGAIKVIGKGANTNDKYSVVNVGKNITLEGWSGIFISHNSSKSYGVEVNVDGKINAISDINGDSGIGIYVNGNIQDSNNSPTINITDNAKIYSNGNGLYIAGYSNILINNAYIQGKHSGIGIKAGTLTINGATIYCDGEDNTPTEGYNNGMNASGVSIQIESNSGYAGNIELNITNGNIISKNSNVIYEYIGKGNNTQVKSISIAGGTFVSNANKDVFMVSNSFKEHHKSFISGGTFSSNPSAYLLSGYNTFKDNNKYVVVKSTIKEINNIANITTVIKPTCKILILILIIFILIPTIYIFQKYHIIKKLLKIIR